MRKVDFKWYKHGHLNERVYAIPVIRSTLYRCNTWLRKQGFDAHVNIDADGYIQYTEKGVKLTKDILWVEGSYLVLLENKTIVFISRETFDRVFDVVEEEEMSDTSDLNVKSMPFNPTMINKVVEIELRDIKDDRVIYRSAGVLKLYTYRDSSVHYRMEAYNDVAVADLDLYYISVVRVV